MKLKKSSSFPFFLSTALSVFFTCGTSFSSSLNAQDPLSLEQKEKSDLDKNKPEKKFSFNEDDMFLDIKTIKDRGELIVGMYYEDKPPFYFVNKSGRLVGNDPELAEAIANAIGPNIRVRYLRTAKTFDEIIQQVHDGKTDIAISKLSYTVPRAKRVLYTAEPYTKLYISFMVNRSIPGSLSLGQLFEKDSKYSLCVIEGSSQVKVAQRLFPSVKLLQVNNAEATVQGLNEGKCVASIRDNNDIRKLLLSQPKLNLRYKAAILKDQPDPIFIVINPKKRDLATFIDQFLENNPKYKKTLNEIFAKYEDQLR